MILTINSSIRIMIMSFLLLLLSACANYHGMHPQEQMLSEQQLVQTNNNSDNRWPNQTWWQDFHDPYLSQLITNSFASQPDIRLAESRVRLAAQMANAAQANSMPLLTGQANVAEQIFSANYIYPPPFGGVWSPFGNLQANFNYEFDFWHKNRETLAAAIGNAQAAQAQVASAKLILASAIAQAYFQIAGDNKLIDLANQSLATQNHLLQLVALENKSGIVSQFPVDQSRQTVANTQILLSQLQNQRQIAINQLNALTTTSLDQDYLKHISLHNENFNELPSNLPLNLLSRRPDLTALKLNVLADSHSINVAKAAFYPDINLVGLMGLQSLGLSELFNNNSKYVTVGPALNLPLFDAGRLRANLGVTDAQYDIAVDQYNQGLENAIKQTADALTQLHSTQDQMKDQSLQLSAVIKNYQYTLSNYNAGTTDALDLFRNKLNVLQNQQQLTQLLIQQKIATIQLIQALGGGYNEKF